MSTMPGMQNQTSRDLTYDASGTITAGGVAQLVLAERKSTPMLLLQNLSAVNMTFECGSARATCVVSGGKVTSVTVTNAGFNFTRAPTVEFLGGGRPGNTADVSAGQPGYDAPTVPAQATCVMASATPLAGNKVSSITIDNPGAGYIIAPYVWIKNSQLDPQGVATPTNAGAGGILLTPYGSLAINDMTNPVDAISVFCATISSAFTVKWRP